MKYLYNIDNLTYSIDSKNLLEKLTIDIVDTPVTIIHGPNGAGKTTFIKLLYGIYKPTKGFINKCFKENIIKTFVFQNPIYLNQSVYENLMHVIYCKNIDKEEGKNMILSLCDIYNFHYLMNKEFNKLSGGEMQLASLLRAMIVNPDLIFYDEPTNNLDSSHFDMIMSIINNLISENKKLIAVSHDKRLFKNLHHKALYLQDMRTIFYE